jgi:UrcA family protein
MLRPVLTASLAAILLSAFTAPAIAQTAAQEVREEVVYIGDVDRYSEAGADVILSRIDRAASHVCGAQGGAMPLPQRVDIRGCTYDAQEDAVDQVNSSVVTAMYYGYTPEVVVSEDEYGQPDDTIVVK